VGRIPPELPEPDAFGFSFGCFGFFFSLRMSLFPMIASLVSIGLRWIKTSDHSARGQTAQASS
jgi:hypothetical protein